MVNNIWNLNLCSNDKLLLLYLARPEVNKPLNLQDITRHTRLDAEDIQHSLIRLKNKNVVSQLNHLEGSNNE